MMKRQSEGSWEKGRGMREEGERSRVSGEKAKGRREQDSWEEGAG